MFCQLCHKFLWRHDTHAITFLHSFMFCQLDFEFSKRQTLATTSFWSDMFLLRYISGLIQLSSNNFLNW
jgi:hypothetical protein